MCTTVKLSSNSFSVVLHKEKVVQLKKLDCEAALSFLKFETFFLRSFVRSFVVIGGTDSSRRVLVCVIFFVLHYSVLDDI